MWSVTYDTLFLHRLKACAYKTGDFILSSGQHASEYLDIKTALLHPHCRLDIIDKVSLLVSPGPTTIIAGLELGGALLANAVAQQLKLAAIAIRKGDRVHGTQRVLEGSDNILGEEAPTILVEDVITTGKSTIEALNALRLDPRLCVHRIVAVIDREQGGIQAIKAVYPHASIHALATLAQLRALT